MLLLIYLHCDDGCKFVPFLILNCEKKTAKLVLPSYHYVFREETSPEGKIYRKFGWGSAAEAL